MKEKRAKRLTKDGRPFGRPPKKPADKMSEPVTVHLTPADSRRLAAEARRAGTSRAAVLLRAWQEQKKAKRRR